MGSSSNLGPKAAAVSQHLALGAIAVVGAGMSIPNRFPMTSGLNTLLWDALDADPAARAKLAATLNKTDGPSKRSVGDRWEYVMAAWATVADGPAARARFQGQFAALDAERSVQPSAAHEALARLVHAGVVECVVSLNWDTALEKTYARLYGVPVPDGVLFKPHGDAARPEVPWTLPHEPGLVPLSVTEMVSLLAGGHARTLMVVGYSEGDQVVVDQLLKPLDTSWRTIRVGPAATGEDDLPAGAEEALPLLAEPFARREDDAAWHPVTYTGSRDIRAALSGERLGPRDVDACPELAEVDLLVRTLRTDRAVVLNGPTGSGKSITAYQALRRIADDGFETLRLRDDARGRGLRTWLADLAAFPRPKVLLLDDAQDMSPDTVRELAEHADADTLVLVVGIDHVAGGVRTVRLGTHAAVARLAWWVRQERQWVFPLVHALDDQVGAHPNDFFFDRRVDIAEWRQAAWQFFYTLTGGWRRMRRAALELRDHDRADLGLLAVAVAQIASVDSGVRRESLTPLAALLGRDDTWLDRSLGELARRRLVIDSEGRLRCAHLQSAYTLLAWMVHTAPWRSPPFTRPVVPPIASAAAIPTPTSPTLTEDGPVAPDLPRAEMDADRDAVCALVAAQLDSPETPLRAVLGSPAGVSTATRAPTSGGGECWASRGMSSSRDARSPPRRTRTWPPPHSCCRRRSPTPKRKSWKRSRSMTSHCALGTAGSRRRTRGRSATSSTASITRTRTTPSRWPSTPTRLALRPWCPREAGRTSCPPAVLSTASAMRAASRSARPSRHTSTRTRTST